jgi:PIN domain nuclease of toxin-antitoxin system
VAALLLDTCAVLWLMNADTITDEAKIAIDAAAQADSVFVSPISAWELGTLVRKGRLVLSMSPDAWFEALLALPGMALAAMPPRTLIASAFLPGEPPADPADRIIAATARAENMILVTRDRKLRSYADAGHVRLLIC